MKEKFFNIQRFAIRGTSGNDTLKNDNTYNVMIYGYGGNDSIYNYYGSNSTIDAGDGDDTVTVYYSDYNSINGGAGNDLITVGGSFDWSWLPTIKGGTGNDTIYAHPNTYGSLYQYASGDGNDTIYNFSSNDTLNITSGNYSTATVGTDFVVYVGSNSIVLKDAIANYAKINIKNSSGNITTYNNYNTRYGTSANDSIINIADSVAIYAQGGNDTIQNYGRYVTMDGGAGNDSIYNNSYYSTINGGEGADTIINYSGYNSINGGAGHDRISLYSNNYYYKNTVKGGKGNDTIFGNSLASSGYGAVYQYSQGDGNDIIYGITSYDTVSINGSINTRSTVGNDIILNMTDGGAITLSGAKNRTPTITVTSGEGTSGKYISNSASNAVITGTAYNDTIYNTGVSVKIYASAGDDSIFNYASGWSDSRVTLDGGAGNDTIMGRFGDSSISGGEGNDLISLTGDVDRATINAGAGNDTIYNDGYLNKDGMQLFQYDVIYGFTSNDTISISGGNYTKSTVGSNVIISVTGSTTSLNGAMTLIGAAGKSFKIYPPQIFTEGDDYYSNSTSYTVLNALAGNDTVYNSGKYVAINGGEGNDSIYNYSTNFSNSRVTLDGGTGNDTIMGRFGDSSISGGEGNDLISLTGDVDRATINAGTGDDTIYNDGYIGMDGRQVFQYASGDGYDIIYGMTTADTIHITSGNISNTSLNGSDVILNVGSGSINLKNYANKYFYLKTGTGSAVSTMIGGGVSINNTISGISINGSAYADSIENSGSRVTITTGDSADTIYNDSYGSSVKVYAGDGNDTIQNWGSYDTIDGGDGNDSITVYNGSYNSINGGAGDDRISLITSQSIFTIKGGTGNDTIFDDTRNGYGRIYQYAFGDGNDLIVGSRNNDTISISGAKYSRSTIGNNLILNVTGGGAITLSGASSKNPTIIGTLEGGVSISNSVNNTVITGTAYNDTIYNTGVGVKIYASAGNDSIYNYSNSYSGSRVTLDGGVGNDTIMGRFGDSSISGGEGNDLISLTGDVDRATINAGAGNDTIYNDGYLNKDGMQLFQYNTATAMMLSMDLPATTPFQSAAEITQNQPLAAILLSM